MTPSIDRRDFLRTSLAKVGAVGVMGTLGMSRLNAPAWGDTTTDAGQAQFKISLAEWSLHKTINGGELTNLEFPAFAMREFGIDAVEYVNQFFKDKAKDAEYLRELNQRCSDAGVKSLLIMVDGEGELGHPEEGARRTAVENHYQWVEAAKTLGCHAIRVNAASRGSYDEQMELAAAGLRQLAEFGAQHDINVIVENHGGLSSNGAWLAGVMQKVDLPNCGTLPDFGNFRIGTEDGQEVWYDRYKGVQELMPYAKAVSAKSHEFNDAGEEVRTDYFRMMKIVLDAGYHGYVGIEWEGGSPGEVEGIRLTQKLLERVRDGVA